MMNRYCPTLKNLFNLAKYNRLHAAFSTTSVLNVQLYESVKEATKDIHDGANVFVGGFGICGVPEKLLEAVSESNVKNLTVTCNNPSIDDYGIGLLVQKKQISKLIASFIGANDEFFRQYLAGEVELEYVPQGTLAERIRAAGAGIPAFFTPTGYGTLIQKGGAPMRFGPNGKIAKKSPEKETRVFNNVHYVLEEALKGDFALIKAWKADKHGNLVFRQSAGNFNAPMCKGAKVTIVEVEELVEPGQLNPNQIHVPSIYCDRLVLCKNYKKPIERLVYRKESSKAAAPTSDAQKARDIIARRGALEFRDGMYVNLGIGIPTLCASYLPKGMTVHLQSENGVIGVGDYPKQGQEDADLVNASKETITLLDGAAIVGSDEAFAMVRGGHIGMTLLGGLQVSQYGDFANWMIPGKLMVGMGGAMDLVSAPGSRVVVTMEHAKNGQPKILEKCTLPLTGTRCVSRIITDMAVFDVDHNEGLTLIEHRKDLSVDDIIKYTGCSFKISPDLKPMGQAGLNDEN